jgi:hypothetical protein
MEFIEFGWDRQMGNVPIGFLPSNLTGLELWTRFNSGITVTGSGVSQWDDVSGNDNHLLQAADAARPSKEADGSILFDGIAHFLKADAFTLVQPETIYILFKQVTWTGSDRIFDGNLINTGTLQQFGVTPQLRLFAGSAFGSESLTIDTYGVVTSVFNSTSSVLQINNDTPATGDVGVSNMGGFALGVSGGSTQHSNIQVKEALIYSEAHDATQRAQVINYLQSI